MNTYSTCRLNVIHVHVHVVYTCTHVHNYFKLFKKSQSTCTVHERTGSLAFGSAPLSKSFSKCGSSPSFDAAHNTGRPDSVWKIINNIFSKYSTCIVHIHTHWMEYTMTIFLNFAISTTLYFAKKYLHY